MRRESAIVVCAWSLLACAAPAGPAAPSQPEPQPAMSHVVGARGPAEPAAGSGAPPGAVTPAARNEAAASPAAPAPAAKSGDDTCPERFTVATRARVEMSWPETIGYLAGTGVLQTWNKITHTRNATGTTLELVPCGVATPVVTTTVLLDNILLANEIPVAAFDRPSMPRYTGSSVSTDGEQVIDTAAMALGTSVAELAVSWPHRTELPLVDHDGDGKPGITALPKHGGDYGLPPADVGQTEHADEIYLASRTGLRYRTRQALCEAHVEGTVEPLGFDYTIVGCHLLSGADCKANQVNLLDNNDPAFTLGAQGHWVSVPLAPTATCADVLAALPAQ